MGKGKKTSVAAERLGRRQMSASPIIIAALVAAPGGLAAVLDYLRARGDVDMGRVGVLGYSLGAIASVLAAAQMPELRCLVIESGFADVHRDIGTLFTRYTGLPSFPFANLIVLFCQLIAGVKLSEIRPVRFIGRLRPRAALIISELNAD